MSGRTIQGVLIASTLLASWLGMQQVHELGHITAAMAIGAKIDLVALHPLTISHTDVGPNKHPLVVVWAGPLMGVVLPALLWLIAAVARVPGYFLLRFFAGFCLLANGLYIGVGSFDRVGDCRQILQHGSQAWQLWLFGAAAAPLGLWLWHGQARQFGIGQNAKPVRRGVTIGSFVACLALLILGFAVGGE
jgi:hypothetical protein